jgi:hypothetical protein
MPIVDHEVAYKHTLLRFVVKNTTVDAQHAQR